MLSYYQQFHFQTLAFILAEVTVIMLKSVHVVSRYLIHLYDLHYVGLWEYKGRYAKLFLIEDRKNCRKFDYFKCIVQGG